MLRRAVLGILLTLGFNLIARPATAQWDRPAIDYGPATSGALVPFAPSIGGFLPYGNAGLGAVATPRMPDRMGGTRVRGPDPGMAAGMGALGAASRSGIVPLAPIRASFGSMGASSMLLPRPMTTPRMRMAPRPPVGFYPFRMPGGFGGGGPAFMAM